MSIVPVTALDAGNAPARKPLRALVKEDSLTRRVEGWWHGIERRLRGGRIVERHVDALGLTYALPTHTLLGRLIRLHGMYEEHIVNWIVERQDALAGQVFVDVGANIGWYTALFARLAGDHGQTFAFEPDPTNYGVLQRSLALNGLQATVIQAAVGETSGTGTLNLGHSSNPGSHSLLDGGYKEGGQISVPIVSLDETVLPQIGDRRVALLKMDIEGYELFALRGGDALLDRTDAIVVEFSPEMMRGAGLDPALLLDLAVDHGFGMARFRFDGPPQPVTRDDLLAPGYPQCDLLLARAN